MWRFPLNRSKAVINLMMNSARKRPVNFPIPRHPERLLCHGRSHHICGLLRISFFFFVTCHYDESHVNQSEGWGSCLTSREKCTRHNWQNVIRVFVTALITVLVVVITVAFLLSSYCHNCHHLSLLIVILIILLLTPFWLSLIIILSSSSFSSSLSSSYSPHHHLFNIVIILILVAVTIIAIFFLILIVIAIFLIIIITSHRLLFSSVLTSDIILYEVPNLTWKHSIGFSASGFSVSFF